MGVNNLFERGDEVELLCVAVFSAPADGLTWREAGLPNHVDDRVDSDQEVVNKVVSL